MKTIIGVYFVIQILIMSSLMVLQLSLILHGLTMFFACLAYLCVSFKKPGYYQKQMKSPSLSDQINPNKIQNQGVINQVSEEQQQEKNNQKCIKSPQIQNQILEEIVLSSILYEKVQKQQKLKSQLEDSKILKLKHQKLNFQNQHQIVNKNQKQLNKVAIQRLKKIKTLESIRYCRICKVYQPYRVRHCHQCQKCICTFDHHCPWMNNCIGEKNRPLFWSYLVMQFIQFTTLTADLWNKALFYESDRRAYALGASLIFVTLVSSILLLFHSYLIMKNLTTWELLRWDRISYLSMYKFKKQSPFSYGFISNVKDYFLPLFRSQSTEWKVNPTYLVKNKYYQKKISEKNVKQASNDKKIVKIVEKTQTQRVISSYRNKE